MCSTYLTLFLIQSFKQPRWVNLTDPSHLHGESNGFYSEFSPSKQILHLDTPLSLLLHQWSCMLSLSSYSIILAFSLMEFFESSVVQEPLGYVTRWVIRTWIFLPTFSRSDSVISIFSPSPNNFHIFISEERTFSNQTMEKFWREAL